MGGNSSFHCWKFTLEYFTQIHFVQIYIWMYWRKRLINYGELKALVFHFTIGCLAEGSKLTLFPYFGLMFKLIKEQSGILA